MQYILCRFSIHIQNIYKYMYKALFFDNVFQKKNLGSALTQVFSVT